VHCLKQVDRRRCVANLESLIHGFQEMGGTHLLMHFSDRRHVRFAGPDIPDSWGETVLNQLLLDYGLSIVTLCSPLEAFSLRGRRMVPISRLEYISLCSACSILVAFTRCVFLFAAVCVCLTFR
jgi:hypothetical protein